MIKPEETDPEDQRTDIGAVDQQTADVDDHRQKADDLLAAPEVAVGYEDAESKADQVEGDDRHIFQCNDIPVFQVFQQGVSDNGCADHEQEDVNRYQHGVHDGRHDRGNCVACLCKRLQAQHRGIQHAGRADHKQRDKPSF